MYTLFRTCIIELMLYFQIFLSKKKNALIYTMAVHMGVKLNKLLLSLKPGVLLSYGSVSPLRQCRNSHCKQVCD